MGNTVSTPNEKVYLLTAGVLSSILLVKLWNNGRVQARLKKELELQRDRESLTQLLLTKRITASDTIKFPKCQNYENTIQQIQCLKNRVEYLKKENLSAEQLLKARKRLIESVYREIANLRALCLARTLEEDRRRRRRELRFVGRFVKAAFDQIRQAEIISFLAKKEILKDSKLDVKEFENEFEILLKTNLEFFRNLEVENEFSINLRFPLKKSDLTTKALEVYFQRRVELLKEIESKGLFEGIDTVSSKKILGLIAHIYIEDKLASERQVEWEEILWNKNLQKTSKIKASKKEFNELFSKLFTK